MKVRSLDVARRNNAVSSKRGVTDCVRETRSFQIVIVNRFRFLSDEDSFFILAIV